MRSDYALLVAGKQARVIVDENGERIEFTAANAARFYALINEAASCLEGNTGSRRPNRPMEFFF